MKKIFTLIALLTTFVFVQAQPGILDPTFGNGGIVTTLITNDYNIAEGMAIQPDGKIIACGNTGPSSSKDVAVARYNTDGTLDNTFSTDGITVIAATVFKDFALAAAVQPDGKILIGGYIFNGSSTDVLLIRLNANGTPDNAFGTNGIVVTDFGGTSEVAEDIALQDDGKILLGGDHDDKFMVIRYNTNGTLDNTFGSGGLASANVGISVCYAKSIAIQDDGKIVAGGMGFNGSSNFGFAVAQFNPNGSPDNTFADNGTKLFNIGGGNDFITAIAIQSDGKIVAGGHTWLSNNPVLQYDFAAVRLNQNGTIDDSFGQGGATSVNIIYGANYVSGMALQADDKIILSGNTVYGSDYNEAIVRLTADGILDTEFGTNGITITDIAGNQDHAARVAIQPDGKIVTAGDTYSINDISQFLIVRYGGNPVGTFEKEMLGFNVYPNPAKEHLNITLPGSSVQYQMDIMDITGKRVYSSDIMQSGGINISALATGTYFIRLKSAEASGISRFIKE